MKLGVRQLLAVSVHYVDVGDLTITIAARTERDDHRPNATPSSYSFSVNCTTTPSAAFIT